LEEIEGLWKKKAEETEEYAFLISAEF